ncbi:hypothetical protein FDP25_14025 [Roseovarius sp. A21]|uniref:Uncharacterized protein n=1 Tax=Roseovarius bejariae TaxID=2576383 RepID=A0A844CZP4_9RHOB|nr:hypothetical protein [Roseovarius bejariae]MRU16556.1 hypothetical protein [Roseovarius bejariae]
MTKKLAIWSLMIGLLPSTTLAQDAVFRMCNERDSDDICACASDALTEKISDEDYAIYEAIGKDYLERMDAGESRADAWTEASRTEAEKRGIDRTALMERTNGIGNIHRTAIKDCGG